VRLIVRVFSALNTAIYRASAGRVGSRLGRAPILLLTTSGRRSGQPRTVPLLHLRDGDDLVVVASYGGRPEHPAWFRNLERQPRAEVEIGRERRAVRARVATAEERERLWPRLVEMYGAYERYQERTTREIPVVLLEPTDAGHGPSA